MALIAMRKPSPSSPIRFLDGHADVVHVDEPGVAGADAELAVGDPVDRPSIPRSSTNAVTPLWPFERSTDAKTRNWSAMSARLIQIFWPLRTYESPSRRAVDWRLPASVPTPGSVSPNVASFSPFAWGTSQRCFCSSVPHCMSVSEFSPTWTLCTTRKAVSARSSSSQIIAKLM